MYKLLASLALAALFTGPVYASDNTDVLAVLHHWVDAFNKGDMKATAASCADETAIVDDIPPHVWHGAGACAKWSSAFEEFAKANELASGHVGLGKPRHLDISGDNAYVVVGTSFSYQMKGKPMKETGATWTVALHKGSSGWRITGWSWAGGTETEVKPAASG